MKRWMRIWALALAVGLVAGLPIAVRSVAAHEHVTVGEYEFIVGWREEPAVAGAKNSLDLGIEHHDPNGTTSRPSARPRTRAWPSRRSSRSRALPWAERGSSSRGD